MRTAIDTNVISALWSKEPGAAGVARDLNEAKGEGGLAISAPVYAELTAHPQASESFVDGFLAETGIMIDFDLTQDIWREAGHRFSRYADRRRQSSRESPKRLLADFLIGAHALIRADRLMTFDPARYQLDFPELKLI